MARSVAIGGKMLTHGFELQMTAPHRSRTDICRSPSRPPSRTPTAPALRGARSRTQPVQWTLPHFRRPVPCGSLAVRALGAAISHRYRANPEINPIQTGHPPVAAGVGRRVGLDPPHSRSFQRQARRSHERRVLVDHFSAGVAICAALAALADSRPAPLGV